MREKNTLSHTVFMFLIYFSGLLAFHLFCKYIYRENGTVSMQVTVGLMIFSLCVFSIVNYFVSRKKNRNIASIFSNIVIPIGIYTAFLDRKLLPVKILCIFALLFTVLPILLYFIQENPGRFPVGRKKVLQHRIKRSFFFARRNFTYAFLAILVLSIAYGTIPRKRQQEKSNEEFSYDREIYEKLPLHFRTLEMEKREFQRAEKYWNTYSAKEKKEVLKKVIEVEASNLALDYSVHLKIENLDDICYGMYRDFEIQLQRKRFQNDSFLEQVETLAHEMYHSFQSKEIKLYEKKTIQGGNAYVKGVLYSKEREKVLEKWKGEFDEYIDGTDEETMEQYYFQDIETSARAYAERRCQKYFGVLGE